MFSMTNEIREVGMHMVKMVDWNLIGNLATFFGALLSLFSRVPALGMRVYFLEIEHSFIRKHLPIVANRWR